MSPTPPSMSKNFKSFEESEALLNQLEVITNSILPLSTGQNLPQLNQLIMRRGQLVDQCRAIDLTLFSPEQKACLQSKINHCQKLDMEIEQNMLAFKTQIHGQLMHLKQSLNLLDKYQSRDTNTPENDFQDA